MSPGSRSLQVAAVLLAAFCMSSSLGNASPAAAQTAGASLEQQLNEQKAKNAALQERIGKLEALLNSDVCKNPEQAREVLKESGQPAGPAAAPAPAAPSPAPAGSPQQSR